MEKRTINIDNYNCTFISDNWKGPCVIYIAGTFMENDLSEIYTRIYNKINKDFIFCILTVDNWDDNLTPWEVGEIFKGRSFGGHGNILLTTLCEKIIPYIKDTFVECNRQIISGYSLAGLFSLWAVYESNIFDGAVCCSPSVWYPDWDKYIESRSLDQKTDIYLSLGDKEEKTKHPLMKQVGERIRQQYAIIQKQDNVSEIILEWNEGGHFADTVDRVSKGIVWMLLRDNNR